MSSTTRVNYTVDAGIISSPTLGFSSIDMLPANQVAFSEQLDVYRNPTGTTLQNLLTVGVDYTINTSTKEITIIGSTASALTAGDVITIDRLTDRASRYVDFSSVGFLRSDTVDFDSDNLLHLIQEAWTRLENNLQKNITETAWNGQNISTINFTPGTANSSLVTLGQVQAIVAGAQLAEFNASYVDYATGDGAQDTYLLNDFPTSGVTEQAILITLDGIIQRPDSYTYTLPAGTNTPQVVFNTAPPNNAAISFRVFEGLIQTVHEDGSISGDALAAGSVDLTKLQTTSGAAKRILSADANGVISAVSADYTYITGFDARVLTAKLNSFTAPDGNVNLNSNKITNLSTGTAAGDAVNKAQLDSAISGVIASAVAAAEAAVELESTFSGNTTYQTNTWYTHSDDPYYVYWRKNASVDNLILQGTPDGGSTVYELGITGANPSAQIGVGGMIPGGWQFRVRQNSGSTVGGNNTIRITTLGAS